MFSVKLKKDKRAFIEKYQAYVKEGIEINDTTEAEEELPYKEIGVNKEGLLRFL